MVVRSGPPGQNEGGERKKTRGWEEIVWADGFANKPEASPSDSPSFCCHIIGGRIGRRWQGQKCDGQKRIGRQGSGGQADDRGRNENNYDRVYDSALNNFGK